jgi:hypothetical protein
MVLPLSGTDLKELKHLLSQFLKGSLPGCKVLFLLHKKQVLDQKFDITFLLEVKGVFELGELRLVKVGSEKEVLKSSQFHLFEHTFANIDVNEFGLSGVPLLEQALKRIPIKCFILTTCFNKRARDLLHRFQWRQHHVLGSLFGKPIIAQTDHISAKTLTELGPEPYPLIFRRVSPKLRENTHHLQQVNVVVLIEIPQLLFNLIVHNHFHQVKQVLVEPQVQKVFYCRLLQA